MSKLEETFMIENAIHLLQWLSCIWLASSVIYPIVNRRLLSAAHSNAQVKYDRTTQVIISTPDLVQPAIATLVLTIIDMVLSAF